MRETRTDYEGQNGKRSVGIVATVVIAVFAAIVGGVAGAVTASILDDTSEKLDSLALVVRRDTYGKAAALLRQVFPQDEDLDTAAALVEQGNTAFDAGDFGSAEAAYAEAESPLRDACDRLSPETLLSAPIDPTEVLMQCGSIQLVPSDGSRPDL